MSYIHLKYKDTLVAPGSQLHKILTERKPGWDKAAKAIYDKCEAEYQRYFSPIARFHVSLREQSKRFEGKLPVFGAPYKGGLSLADVTFFTSKESLGNGVPLLSLLKSRQAASGQDFVLDLESCPKFDVVDCPLCVSGHEADSFVLPTVDPLTGVPDGKMVRVSKSLAEKLASLAAKSEDKE